MHHTDKDVR